MSFWLRARALFRRNKVEQELDDELRFHLEMRERENLASGMTLAEARADARRRFGAVEKAKDYCRDTSGFNIIDSLIRDLRYGFRQLRKSPVFTAVVGGSLALGIGANTAIFSFVDGLMLKALPVAHPEQLVQLGWKASHRSVLGAEAIYGNSFEDQFGGERSTSFSYEAFRQVRAAHVLTDVMAFIEVGKVTLAVAGNPQRAEAFFVSGNFYSLLGVRAAAGRLFTDADDIRGTAPVAVIGYDFWQTGFAADPTIVGKNVEINHVPFTIIGVSAPGFFGMAHGQRFDIGIPLSTQPQVEPRWTLARTGSDVERPALDAPSFWWLEMVGRLTSGVSAAQARAQLDSIFQHTIDLVPPPPPEDAPRENPSRPHLETLAVARGLQEVESDYSRPLWVLMTLVGLVLLIACANVANLMLARAAARQREIAVRLSLGAARRRVFRQLLTESILLALLGATAGLVVARWTMRALTPMVLVGQPDLALDVHLDLRVLAFTAAVALVTGVLFGLVPALRGTRLDVNQALKAAGSGSRNSSSSESRLTRILVSAQVALSLLLLVGAGLFVRTLIKLEAVPLGLNSRNVLLFGIDPSQNGYTGAHLLRFYERLLERVRATPAVESASIIWMPLMSGSADETTITLPAQGKQPERKLNVYGNVISPDFFRTMQIPLLAGRDFRASDAAAAPRVAIVNRLFAHAYFGSETVNAVGRHFKFDRNELTVIGVAADTPYRNLRNPPPPTVFLPFTQVDRLGWLHIAIRSALPPTTLVPMLRGAVRAIDDSVPLYDIRTQTQQIDQSLALERLFARVSSFFGILALLLAAIGIYGVLAYSVTRRINEIGIRVALGAQRHRVIGLVVRDSLVLVCSGALIGLAVTLPCTRLLSSMVFGISTTDPATLGGAIGLMLAVSGLAAFVPAHRAAQIDPMVALRYE